MTTETTEPTTQAPQERQLSSFMTALSLAETLLSQAHAMPYEFVIRAIPYRPDEPEIRFYFDMDIPGLRQFRDDHMLTETMRTTADGSVHIEATADVRGVRVVAWTLTDPPPVETTESAEGAEVSA